MGPCPGASGPVREGRKHFLSTIIYNYNECYTVGIYSPSCFHTGDTKQLTDQYTGRQYYGSVSESHLVLEEKGQVAREALCYYALKPLKGQITLLSVQAKCTHWREYHNHKSLYPEHDGDAVKVPFVFY